MMWLADHSLRVLALVLVVAAGSVLAYRASARSRLFAWTAVLCVAMVMPLLTTVLPTVEVPLGFSDPVIVVSQAAVPTAAPAAQARVQFGSSSRPLASPWWLAVYLTGVVFLLSRLAAGAYLTARAARHARPVEDPALAAEVRRCSQAMRMRRCPRVLQHSSVHVPFVCGIVRPALLLPEAWATWDDTTRHAVLTHELSHIVRRDLWTVHAASIYRAFTWMSPISWWLRRRLETLAERASDDAVLASGVEPVTYAELLVRFFDAAQRAPGRANWQLAMARRSGAEARKRVGRVLNAREGGNVRFGILGRVLVGVAVLVTAIPVVVVTASQTVAVAVQAPAVVNLGLETQAELRIVATQLKLADPPTTIRAKRIELNPVATPPVERIELQVVPAQEQEPEPWRSTRNSADEGVVAPVATYRTLPKYTSDAMRAKIQGSVTIEAIVSAEGDVTAARVKKSLDTLFGLDDEALKSAREWKFVPGTHQGQPIATRVILELEFKLH